ncbi:MAG: anaerobic ribonucleoside-triphosphate reductase activating protein [Candidatus Pacebacteria bacterium]|nr:anaerobic ribonucleoside-triphosphate reductase activating protein [Candidatus Paceibacterota bacterium]
MFIGGFQKFTLLDYPGKIAAVVFTMGCNFRCPYCHNPEIVDPKKINYGNKIETEEVLKFLGSRKNDLDGVCITGGEPTLQPGLVEFVKRIKELGFLVKIDTNASHLRIIKDLSEKKLVDYWAVDLKTSPKKYEVLTRKDNVAENIGASIDLITKSNAEMELRTTVAPGIVGIDDFDEMIKWINKINPETFSKLYRYSVQDFKPETTLDEEFGKVKPYSKEDLEIIADKIKKHCGNVVVLD